MKKFYKHFLLLLGSVFLIGEVVGRYYGLTTYPLFRSDPNFEYISAPNQDVRIYRNRFVVNQYSQRSEPLLSSDSLVYLLIGDSVVYGGNVIDQDSLASTLLEKRLQQETGQHVRMLNISSKSWGPDNSAAYIRKYGTFKARQMVLVVSSHDAYDNMTFKPMVGVQDSHPDKNALLAWSKIIEKGWAAIDGKLKRKQASMDTSGLVRTEKFNPGFDAFRTLSDSLNIPLVIYLHKAQDELKTGQLEAGGPEIRAYCKKYGIKLIEGDEKPAYYEDGIHFNERGQCYLSEILYPIIIKPQPIK